MKQKTKKLKPCNCPSAVIRVSVNRNKRAIGACREVKLEMLPGGGWIAKCSICGGQIQLRADPIPFNRLPYYSS